MVEAVCFSFIPLLCTTIYFVSDILALVWGNFGDVGAKKCLSQLGGNYFPIVAAIQTKIRKGRKTSFWFIVFLALRDLILTEKDRQIDCETGK